MAATAKSLLDIWQDHPEVLNMQGMQNLLLGSIIAFIVAFMAVRFFIQFLKTNGFKWFGVYRIILGVILITLILSGKL
jgi:undecaprenyl-diphosphatase